MAINAPMQGTAADIIKQAMIDIFTWQSEPNTLGVHMIMQVHDELVFEVEEPHQDHAILHIRSIMEQSTLLDVPLKVSIGIGNNWDEAHQA